MNIEKQTLTTQEAAQLLGIDKRTLDNWRSLGRGPAYCRHSKRLIRYRRVDIEAYQQASRIEPANA